MNEYKDFITPLKKPADHYGEVPFYWWNGEKLNKKRLTAQLEALAKNGIAGVQVNYAHGVGGGEEGLPYGGAGRTLPGDPAQFTDDWWEFFRHTAKECERLGLCIGMGDYTIAWIGNGYFADAVADTPGMGAQVLCAERKMVFSREDLGDEDGLLAAVTYDDADFTRPRILFEAGRETDFRYGCYDAFLLRLETVPRSIDPLAEGCGETLVHLYFEEFERRLPDVNPGTLNYFFQDELLFGADVKRLWRENLRERVKRDKGYDPLGFLPHLFYRLGTLTAKIRLDIADARTALMEENYFKPVFDFHNERGMIYGCDQSSRGRDPGEFSDYFRAVRWFTAPGNDTPGRAADLIKVKVNSSIAHLYNRPRVWLEGYHSSGWGTSPASVTAPTDDNFLYGANLLNLHGLYYSTYGGFFEWAPPDFHFRMPYWDDEKQWLLKYKRLSAMLTTGVHVCDAAVFYPVSSFDYGEDADRCRARTFETAEFLFNRGVDFDFIDRESILNAEIDEGRMKIAGGGYQMLLLAAVDCVRFDMMEKLEAFAKAGGSVVFYELAPYESDLPPEDRQKLPDTVEAILSAPGGAVINSHAELLQFVNSHVRRRFLPDTDDLSEKLCCTARETEGQKLFFLRYCAKDSVCRFEAGGQPFLLDPYTGKVNRLLGTVYTEGFTFVKLPLEADENTVIVFTDDFVPFDGEINTAGFETALPRKVIPLEGDWDFSLRPTLDNRWGDFYLPAGGFIGAEARFFRCAGDGEDLKDKAPLPYCHSLSIAKIDVDSETGNVFSIARACAEGGRLPDLPFASPLLHDRYGYVHKERNTEPALYDEGYHGLKGRVHDYNMIFDGDCVFFTDVYCAAPTHAWLYLTGVTPDVLFVNGKKIAQADALLLLPAGRVRLAAGFVYDDAKTPDYVNRAKLKRAGVYLTTEKFFEKPERPLTVTAFANPLFLPFMPPAADDVYYDYAFFAVPGTYGFEGNFFGELQEAQINGEPMEIEALGDGNFGGRRFRAVGPKCEGVPEITFTLETDPGAAFTGAIPEPVSILHENGRLPLCDVSKTGALINYSGKMAYRKTVTLGKRDEDSRVLLSLGQVFVTASVQVNGKNVGILTYPPFVCDITDAVTDGENEIEITVSNTLCNHYSTAPSAYSNFPEDAASGLVGPVEIRIE